ncbi:MAG: G/U mismatch-specific DNA glycosylase [Gemmatimonadota bacterium]|nr:G/U mismatch-specific DNA glycosylase [Gemmatimonadota bacterium]
MNVPSGMHKPTADALRAAAGRPIPDIIAPGLDILFCGVNPGLYSAATGRHFARPGNRFWPALHMAGFTRRLLAPHENHEILEEGYGITSLVHRATATAREVLPAELVTGGRRLVRTARTYRPRWIAVFGVGAYRIAFDNLRARVGPQQEQLAGAHVWLLPSPSGANGSYPLVDLVHELRTFHEAVARSGPGGQK